MAAADDLLIPCAFRSSYMAGFLTLGPGLLPPGITLLSPVVSAQRTGEHLVGIEDLGMVELVKDLVVRQQQLLFRPGVTTFPADPVAAFGDQLDPVEEAAVLKPFPHRSFGKVVQSSSHDAVHFRSSGMKNRPRIITGQASGSLVPRSLNQTTPRSA